MTMCVWTCSAVGVLVLVWKLAMWWSARHVAKSLAEGADWGGGYEQSAKMIAFAGFDMYQSRRWRWSVVAPAYEELWRITRGSQSEAMTREKFMLLAFMGHSWAVGDGYFIESLADCAIRDLRDATDTEIREMLKRRGF